MTTALEPELSTFRWSSNDPAGRFPVEDPATGEVITLVQGGGAAQVDAAVEAAHRAFQADRRCPRSSASRPASGQSRPGARSTTSSKAGPPLTPHREAGSDVLLTVHGETGWTAARSAATVPDDDGLAARETKAVLARMSIGTVTHVPSQPDSHEPHHLRRDFLLAVASVAQSRSSYFPALLVPLLVAGIGIDRHSSHRPSPRRLECLPRKPGY
jgi:hypothetical protein